MPQTINGGTLRLLRWLDQRADKIRKELELHQRGETVTWYMSENDPDRFFEVIADGYGRFTLVDYQGINPNDRNILHDGDYDNEKTASRAAWRLGECGVEWLERDIQLGDRENDEFPEPE
jgi:hypothetical protein